MTPSSAISSTTPATPRAVAKIEEAIATFQSVAANVPSLALSLAFVNDMLLGEAGVSIGVPSSFGLGGQKGFAAFFTRAGAVLVLPVADRDKFLEAVHGTKGADSDTALGRTCKTVRGVYACAGLVGLLDTLGTGGLSDHLAITGSRGEIEAVLSQPRPAFALAGAMQLEHGGAVMRWGMSGLPAKVTNKIGRGYRPRVTPSTTGFAVIDVTPFLEMVPPFPLVPGVTADALARSISGPVTISTEAGIESFDVRVALSDPKPAQQFIDQCAASSYLQSLSPSSANGVCHLTLPNMSLAFDVWIANRELRIGSKTAVATTNVPLPAMGKELAAAEWPLVLYGHGSMFQPPPFPESKVPVFLSEIAFAMRMEGSTLRGVASARTAWDNPPELISKLLAIDTSSPSAAATAKALASANPTTPFASDFAGGWPPLLLAQSGFAMMLSVGFPAMMDSFKANKVSETDASFESIARHLETLVDLDGHFPKGKAPLSPSRSCCKFPHAKCDDAAAWKHPVWVAMGFSMEQPHLYRYDYESTDGKSFVAHAVGDLDCDGIEITYTMSGSFDPQGNVTTKISAPPPNTD